MSLSAPPVARSADTTAHRTVPSPGRYTKIVELVLRLGELGREMARYPSPERDAEGRVSASPQAVILAEQESDVIDRLALQGLVFTERFRSPSAPRALDGRTMSELDDDHRGVIEDQAARLAQLSEALLARTDIGRAQGIMMAELHLNSDEAVAALSAVSHVAGESVHRMARAVVRQAEETADSTTSLTPMTNTPG